MGLITRKDIYRKNGDQIILTKKAYNDHHSQHKWVIEDDKKYYLEWDCYDKTTCYWVFQPRHYKINRKDFTYIDPNYHTKEGIKK